MLIRDLEDLVSDQLQEICQLDNKIQELRNTLYKSKCVIDDLLTEYCDRGGLADEPLEIEEQSCEAVKNAMTFMEEN